jgi:mono/diheme cytochrome c family protein
MFTFIKIMVVIGGFVLFAVACNNNTTEKTTPPDPLAEGRKIFQNFCVTCHGADGKLALNGASDLSASVLPLEGRVAVITNGRKLMQPWSGTLTERQINLVAAYTLTLKK